MRLKVAIIVIILILIASSSYWYYTEQMEFSEDTQATLDEQRQNCIDKYGTKEDPLGLSPNADPRLAECLKQVDPQDPLGIL